jgi:transposase
MGKKAHLDISESYLELNDLLKKQNTLKKEKRIRCLLDIKTQEFTTRQDLADSLRIHIRTLERWIINYKSGGIQEFLHDKPKNKQSKIITPKIHKAIEQRVNSSTNPFLGYWDAQSWVNSEYGLDVKYHRIREYLIQHFKTKLKVPRKSHYKKDDEAEEAFLKTP